MNKKFLIVPLIILVLIFSFPFPSLAKKDWDNEKNLEWVNSIGNRMLEKNNLPANIQFYVADEDHINAYANIQNEVHVYRGLLEFVETENELAAVIGHEIGHIVNHHVYKQTFLRIILSPLSSLTQNPIMSKIIDGVGFLSFTKVSRKDEYEADLSGVELMIGAGYNPLGMISVLNKITGSYFDLLSTHPSGDKRVLNVYDYLSYNFPSYVEKDYHTESYQSFMLFMDDILEKRQNNPNEMAKYEREQEKLREKRLARNKKIQTGESLWAIPAGFLKSL